MNTKSSKQIAAGLLQIGAIKLNPDEPYTWASGWKSPIYCDNRMSLSHPELRELITQSFLEQIDQLSESYDCIAGVATGGIPYGALVADRLSLPMVYVRPTAKAHGRNNTVEGDLQADWNCLVIEDLVSTGGSSMKAVISLRDAGARVTDTISIFTYGFGQAVGLFQNGNCRLHSLVHYDDMSSEAHRLDYISQEHISELKSWREDPSRWRSN